MTLHKMKARFWMLQVLRGTTDANLTAKKEKP